MPLIMIVDDQVAGGLLLRAVLQRAGFADIQVLTSPFAALDACQVAPPDILVTDLRMPGMDGLELFAALRQALPPARVPTTVLVSGDREPETVRRVRASGVAHFLEKPLDIGEFRECLVRLSRRPMAA
jgi:CheY-like chemotaxis protein